ncbi:MULTISPECIES: hypothetical protein [unclassified Oceanobacillus]|uniref:hypothetical protein n=1 Tax=unclassified Oceanobacillus TaxID=2630292 RepID=UPI00300E163E
MRSKIPGHLVNGYQWSKWADYENYVFDDEKASGAFSGFKDTPSKEECDKLCAALSGEVTVYKMA